MQGAQLSGWELPHMKVLRLGSHEEPRESADEEVGPLGPGL